MIRNLAAFVLALVAVTALADQPSREQVTRPLYVLGSHHFAKVDVRQHGRA